jgi:2-phospho-L-lactate guanylyltransferase
MKCWAIVPVKRLAAAKSRLAPILSLRRRRALVCLLLTHTLKALKHARGISGILVIGQDRAVRGIARTSGAEFIAEGEQGGLNRALARAAAEAVRRGADSLLILPADLPLLAAADVSAALKIHGRPPFLLIAPDRAERGTNLLRIAPPGLIRFSFGSCSFQRHVSSARRAGARVRVLRRPSLAQDLDCPEDLINTAILGWPGGKQFGNPPGKPFPRP